MWRPLATQGMHEDGLGGSIVGIIGVTLREERLLGLSLFGQDLAWGLQGPVAKMAVRTLKPKDCSKQECRLPPPCFDAFRGIATKTALILLLLLL